MCIDINYFSILIINFVIIITSLHLYLYDYHIYCDILKYYHMCSILNYYLLNVFYLFSYSKNQNLHLRYHHPNSIERGALFSLKLHIF